MRENDKDTKRESERNGAKRRVHGEGTRVEEGGRKDQRENETED